MKKASILLFLFFYIASCSINQEECDCPDKTNSNPVSVEFPSLDGLSISANLYHVNEDSATIILCHQARFNKIEYSGIAKKLRTKGYNCLAIDQRSGGDAMDVYNETYRRAMADSLPVGFLDAEKDIVAAVEYAKTNYNGKIILWGSSYSSSLVLKVARSMETVDAVLSFSPGKYFGPTYSLMDSISGLQIPCFVTSSRAESNPALDSLLSGIPSENLTRFTPVNAGLHGSRALWEAHPGNAEYWDAVNEFLKELN
ncbi:MAG: hypothetical protein RIM99_13265 [Cyclobacteriaceae bacterium]